ncbi:LLM class flavin-dependent oxidoreductase [Mycobacterium sp. Aquia_216]|uniref:LLM class flavin-dependent oxidoreductase n=1 Tax=Mycobacterium sp. Aquia_216 TaxID=2991729 RepID=UPI00227B9575|nr:LLM class flavin-dependent oxidoreductase [Mycobacterium sp. Aquia_216]WAJ45353.1 LLM class flavin-dependent oxidoreductase [Mycobacterium sp. Aquia_216]
MSDVKLGAAGVYFPPFSNVVEGARRYEAEGLDFILQCDQLNLSIPRSIWTPDLVKAAETFDVDCWMDPWVCVSAAASCTDRIEFSAISDAMRRSPPNLAQMALSMDHASSGRFTLVLGAGEHKQFGPYGLVRRKPFAHLEEATKIIKLLMDAEDTVDYDGPIWSLKDAVLPLGPYGDRPPPIIIAGGPGRSMEIAGRYADGWLSYYPAAGDARWFAQGRDTVRNYAIEAGQDPDALEFYGTFLCLIGDTEDEATALTHNLALRWDAAIMCPGGRSWQQWNPNNPPHPLGDDFHYTTDFVPMEWSREDALKICEQVPPSVVRDSKFTGTPEQIADMVVPYIRAGMTHVLIANYGQTVTTGDFGDIVANADLLNRTFKALRDRLE